MNLILFEASELALPLPRRDPRALHIVEVLRRREGDFFDVGLINGPRGKARVATLTDESLALGFSWEAAPPPDLDPITLLVGLPRPQTARKILQESATLGVSALHFVLTEKGEPSYAQSTLWSSGEWRRHVVAGAEQAFSTRLPVVTWGDPLATVLAGLAGGDSVTDERLALDLYEASVGLGAHFSGSSRSAPKPDRVVLALGPERDWGVEDRVLLREHAFTLAHLGSRVLRSETAVVAAVTLTQASLGNF